MQVCGGTYELKLQLENKKWKNKLAMPGGNNQYHSYRVKQLVTATAENNERHLIQKTTVHSLIAVDMEPTG